MKLLLTLALLVLGPHTVSGNFPRDLYGPVDTRGAGAVCNVGPCIWGHADSDVLPLKFYPPPGYRVRVLSLRGDLVAWIKSLPGDAPTLPESAAGVMLGYYGSNPNWALCDYCAEGYPLYIQDSVTQSSPKTRAPYVYDGLNFPLPADNTLYLVVAEFLNTTGKPIHLEATYTVKFVFEKEQQQ
jgi:hypothetical protein